MKLRLYSLEKLIPRFYLLLIYNARRQKTKSMECIREKNIS